jgi:hypothetical protein
MASKKIVLVVLSVILVALLSYILLLTPTAPVKTDSKCDWDPGMCLAICGGWTFDTQLGECTEYNGSCCPPVPFNSKDECELTCT